MTYNRGFGLTRAVVEIVGTPVVTATATSVVTASAHGQTNGTRGTLTNISGLTGVSLATLYYVVGATANTFGLSATFGGTAIAMGTGTPTFNPITEVELAWPNKIGAKVDNKELTWEGGDAIEKANQMLGLSFDLDLDCVPTSAHRLIFDKAAMTSLPGGFSDGTGIGGGNDTSGVSCGFFTEGNTMKAADNGTVTTVTRRRWVPNAKISLSSPGDQSTGGKDGQWKYTITASRAKADILGVAIPNVASNGDFIIDMV
jgi:hypothetical protein